MLYLIADKDSHSLRTKYEYFMKKVAEVAATYRNFCFGTANDNKTQSLTKS